MINIILYVYYIMILFIRCIYNKLIEYIYICMYIYSSIYQLIFVIKTEKFIEYIYTTIYVYICVYTSVYIFYIDMYNIHVCVYMCETHINICTLQNICICVCIYICIYKNSCQQMVYAGHRSHKEYLGISKIQIVKVIL